jgi:RNA polymerase sigma-70 factor, ECF subfamily
MSRISCKAETEWPRRTDHEQSDSRPELLHDLQEGRPEAFALLFTTYRAQVYSLAARMLGDIDEAQDATQEAFLKALQSIPRDKRPIEVEPWLYRVAANVCVDRLRTRKRRAETDIEEVAASTAPDRDLEHAETSQIVERTLSLLPERHRVVLLLKDLYGFSNEEIASTLGVSRGAAEALLSRARGAFRRTYGELAQAPQVSAGSCLFGLGFILPLLPLPGGLQAPPALPSGGGAALLQQTAGASGAGAAATAASGSTGIVTSGGGLLANLGAVGIGKTAVVVLASIAVAGVTAPPIVLSRIRDSSSTATLAARSGGEACDPGARAESSAYSPLEGRDLGATKGRKTPKADRAPKAKNPKAEKSPRAKNAKADKAPKAKKTSRANPKVEKTAKADKTAKVEKTAKADKTAKVEKTAKAEKAEKADKTEKAAKTEETAKASES